MHFSSSLSQHPQRTNRKPSVIFCFDVGFPLSSFICLFSRTLFSLMFPLCFLNWTQLCAFKGGWEPINSSSWLPCHQWPAHPFTHWPPGITAWKKVCVCLCGRVRMRLCCGFRCSEFWLACQFGFFHEAKQTSFHALLLNNWKKKCISVFARLQRSTCYPSDVQQPHWFCVPGVHYWVPWGLLHPSSQR